MKYPTLLDIENIRLKQILNFFFNLLFSLSDKFALMQPSLSSSKVNKLTSIFFNINHSSCQHVSQYLFPLIYLHFFFYFNVSRRHTEQKSIDIDDIMHLSSLAAKRKFNILVFIRFCVKEKAFKKILPGKIKLLAVRK